MPDRVQAALLPARFLDLHELPKDLSMVFGRNATTRIPDFDADAVAATPTTDQNATAVRVLDGVRDEVTQNSPQKLRVASRSQRCRTERQANPPLCGHDCKRVVQHCKEAADADRRHVRIQGSRIKLDVFKKEVQ